MNIPVWLLQHSVTVEPYLGHTAYGPQYGPPVIVRCFLDQQTRTIRAADGTQTTSSSTAYARLDTVAPALSRVTLPDGRVTSVLAALRRDGGKLPTPSHMELQFV
jgi:hypothetical protein